MAPDPVMHTSAQWSPAFRYALYLWQAEAKAPTDAALALVDARSFTHTLARHRLALALPSADTLPPGMPETLRAVLRQRQRQMTLRMLQQTAALREIVASLEQAGLRYCLLKGQGYAALFEATQRREACDIDLLISAADRNPALRHLQALGYRLDPAAASDLEQYCADNHALPLRHATSGVVLELHLRLANRPGQFQLENLQLWDRHIARVMVGGMEVATLSAPAAVAYAAFHGTKHNWCRAFWLVDMALAMRSTTLDWAKVLDLAQRLGTERHLAMSVLLAEATLGVATPEVFRSHALLLRAARPAADALLPHLDALGSDRGADLAARMGMVRYGLRLLSLESSWHGRLQLIPFLLAPTEDDRAAVALPPYLRWAYPGVRAVRLAHQHMTKRRRV